MVSDRPASFFAYTGRTSKPEKPAKMNRALSAMTATNGAVAEDVAIRARRARSYAPSTGGDGTRNSITIP